MGWALAWAVGGPGL